MGNYLRRSRETEQGHGVDISGPNLDRAHGIHRGLQNMAGENNCFLNVTVQALWHLDTFRDAIRREEATSDVNELCLDDMLVIVNSLFAQYEYSDRPVLPPTELRNVLTALDPHKFSTGALADATEALSCILCKIHEDRGRAEGHAHAEDDSCFPVCLAHSGQFVRIV